MTFSLELYIDDVLIQQGGVELMMYPPLVIQKELSSFMKLQNGDVLMTGTPKGVGVVNKGSTFKGKVLEKGEILVEVVWTAQ